MKIKDYVPNEIHIKVAARFDWWGNSWVDSDFDFKNKQFAKDALILLLKNNEKFLENFNVSYRTNLNIESDISEIPEFPSLWVSQNVFRNETDCEQFNMHFNNVDGLYINYDTCVIYKGDFNHSKILKLTKTDKIGQTIIGFIEWKI